MRWLRARMDGIPVEQQQPGAVVSVERGVSAERLPLTAADAWPAPVEGGASPGLPGSRELGDATSARRDLERLAAAAQQPVAVVTGPAGSGKARLVRDHVAALARSDAAPSLVWWIDAADESAADAGLLRLALAVGGGLAADQDVATLRALAMRWLDAHQGWLLVLDGVAHPIQVRGLLARFPRGRFLVTARDAEPWYALAPVVKLDPPEPRPDGATVEGPEFNVSDLAAADLDDPVVLYRKLPRIESWAARCAPGRDTSQDADILARAALGLARAGDWPRAVVPMERAARALARHLGDVHPDTLAAWNNVGCLLLGVHNPSAALALGLLERNLRACEAVAGPDSEFAAAAARNLACAYLRVADGAWRDAGGAGTGAPYLPDRDARTIARREDAIDLFRRCLERASRVHGDDHEVTWLAQEDLAAAYHTGNQYLRFQTSGGVEEAVELLEDAWTWRALSRGEDDRASLECRMRLGTALAQSVYAKHKARAESVLRETYESCERLFGADSETTLRALLRLGSCYGELVSPEAVELYGLLFDRCRAVLGVTDELTMYAGSLAWLAAQYTEDWPLSDRIQATREADAANGFPPAPDVPTCPPSPAFVNLVQGDPLGAARLVVRERVYGIDEGLSWAGAESEPGPDPAPDPAVADLSSEEDVDAGWPWPVLEQNAATVARNYRLRDDDPSLLRARETIATARRFAHGIGRLL